MKGTRTKPLVISKYFVLSLFFSPFPSSLISPPFLPPSLHGGDGQSQAGIGRFKDPTWVHLLRRFHFPEAPKDLDDPRLGPENPGFFQILRGVKRGRANLAGIESSVHRSSGRAGSGGIGNDTLDFEFSNVFDHALFPERFVAEIERTLKPGGVCVLHVALSRQTDKYSANDLYSVTALEALFRRSAVVRVGKIDGFGLDTEVVFRKTTNRIRRS